MKYDFAGWVTKNDIQCTDGVTIRHGAFAHQDGVKVPLVWEHKHDDPANVLGHVILEHRDEGVYGYVKCNSTPNGQNAKIQVKEGDITSFSIYANRVQKKAADVVHGVIREVSLVLSGANPGAMIIEHSDMSAKLRHRTDDDSLIAYCDSINGSLISEISHGEDSEGRSPIADPARAADAEGSVNADSIGNDAADTLGRQSSNSLQFCTECGTARRGNFCGGCGADMRIDSQTQSQNEDGQQNGRALRNVQHTGFDPKDSLTDTDYDDTVLAHEGAAGGSGDGGSGESGAQGDGPKSDSYYGGVAEALIDCYGVPAEGADIYEHYVKGLEDDGFEPTDSELDDIMDICKIFEEEWGIKHSSREERRAARQERRAARRQSVGNAVRNAGNAARNVAQRVRQGVYERTTTTGRQQRLERATNNLRNEMRRQEINRSRAAAAQREDINHSDRGEQTLDEIIASLNEDQQAAVAFLLSQVETNGELAQSDVDSQYEILHTFTDEQQNATNLLLDLVSNSIESVQHTEDPKSNQNKGDETLKHNVFNAQATTSNEEVLSHSERSAIFADISSGRAGTMKDVLKHASITNIEVLFPEARNITTEPQVFKDRNRNANRIVDATNRVPWGRVKTTIADFTEDEARARGYITGAQKVESIFKAVFRATHPTTVYRKQNIDRDHVIDIEDFDIIRFMNAQMRTLLVEELARAILVGDGRAASHPDKIDEENIRPILTDDDIWTVKIGGPEVKLDDLDELILLGMVHYQGSGEPVMFAHPAMTARIRTLRDNENRYMFPNLADYAARIGVQEIIPTTFMPIGKFIIGNLSDYTVGSARGGEITTFEDFDIDFNLHKYLIETRLSGATTTPKAFIAGEYEDAFGIQSLPSLPVGPNLGK